MSKYINKNFSNLCSANDGLMFKFACEKSLRGLVVKSIGLQLQGSRFKPNLLYCLWSYTFLIPVQCCIAPINSSASDEYYHGLCRASEIASKQIIVCLLISIKCAHPFLIGCQ